MVRLRGSLPSTFLMAITIVAWALALFGAVTLLGEIGRWKEDALAGGSMFLFWGVVGGVFLTRYWWWSPHHVRIDRGRATATIVDSGRDAATRPIVELGELSIKAREGRGYVVHELHASGFPEYRLFWAYDAAPVEQRKTQLEDIVGEYKLRELLARDAPDTGAFRADPDLAFRARQVVSDPDRMQRVLAVLERDSTVAAHVKELRAALER